MQQLAYEDAYASMSFLQRQAHLDGHQSSQLKALEQQPLQALPKPIAANEGADVQRTSRVVADQHGFVHMSLLR